MEERRRYYRIDDQVSLKYRILEDQNYAEEIEHVNIGYIRQTDLRNACRFIDSRLEAINLQISKTAPLIAESLTLLNRKLSMLETIIENDAVEDVIDTSQQNVNLSGSGIAFLSEKAVLEDSPLKLELVLYPETEYITLLGRVVSCREQKDSSYIIAVDFEGINEETRELIVHHIIKKQTQALRKNSEDEITTNAAA